MRALLLTSTLLLALVAGCLDDEAAPAGDAPVPSDLAPTLPGFTALPLADLPTFSAPLLIDDVRAGGEPVIAITHDGTLLVSAHPGFTHYHPSTEQPQSSLDIVSPFAGQSYLWRSTDGGATWTHIGLPGSEEGPRSLALGVSDPEFTVMEDGAICYTDLEGLAMASVACSTDDGLTWMPGNPIASGAPVDRQWMASFGDELYFTANYLAVGEDFRASTDHGLTWEDRGSSPCNGDVVANPTNGHLVQGCGPAVTVSDDGARTWSEERGVPGHETGSRAMSEPAIDSAGNVWVTWSEDEASLWAAGSPDEGMTWPWVIDLTAHVRLVADRSQCPSNGPAVLCEADESDPTAAPPNGTFVWPWISAGSQGRFAVSWFGSYLDGPSDEQAGPWYVFSAFVVGADTPSPTVVVSRLTTESMHDGPICQAGTSCQVASMQGDPNGDRRLGDFFETTIGPDGFLYGAWSNTHDRPNDVISHAQFVRQTGGLRLIAPEDLGSFVPTQG
jgi:hypothetical protein